MYITILSSSTRINRLSHRVALALAARIKSDGQHTAEILDLAQYNFPIMEEVITKLTVLPEGLTDFADKIARSDGSIFVSPEYNGSYTAALKNAVDVLSENNFSKKVIGVCSVSNGASGGMRAAMLMQQLVLGVGGYAIPQMLLVGHVDQRFDENGQLTDPLFEKKLTTFLTNFEWLTAAVAAKKSDHIG